MRSPDAHPYVDPDASVAMMTENRMTESGMTHDGTTG